MKVSRNSEKKKKYHIHIGLSLFGSQGRGILEGISDYAGHRPDWDFGITGTSALEAGPPYADAFVGCCTPQQVASWDESQRRRVVNVTRSHDYPGIASVTCDDLLIGRMAAEYLLTKELTTFVYHGLYSERKKGFCEALQEAGKTCCGLAGGNPQAVQEWIAQLPCGTGIMTFNDGAAVRVLSLAEEMGRSVPNDLAVIGVDDDYVQSLLAPIPITSVVPDFRKVGYVAAEMLDRMLAGYDACEERIRVPPLRVHEQESSDFPGFADEVVVRAARYIRRNACSGINASDVVRMMPLSRRPLEKRFRQAFGRTILEEIQRARIAHASMLLAQSDLSVASIAEQAGFNSGQWFAEVFHETLGCSPTAYRRKYRKKA
jgi:LacI family transcriptional regulator